MELSFKLYRSGCDMKKVAIVLPGGLPVPSMYGGAIESTIQLVVEQNENHKQINLTVISPYEKKAKEHSASFEQTKFIWIHRGRLYNFANFFIRALRKIFFKNMDHLDGQILKWHVRRGGFDTVIIHGNTNHLLALRKVLPKEKIVFYVHANLFKCASKQNLIVGRAAGRYVCVSEFIKGEIVKNAGVNPESITVIKNPIDLEKFSRVRDSTRPKELVQKYNVQDDESVLLFVGRIVESKGIKHLMLALKSLPETVKFKLLVVGSFGSSFGRGHQKDAFYDQLMSISSAMQGRVVFTGFVHNSELPQYHALADIIIMPSLCEEAAGKVAMEGMASGRPVIVTDAGGIPEYVTGECGVILRRDGDFVASLADAIDGLMRSRKKRVTMGAAGAIAAQFFSPEIYYKNYVRLALGL